MPSALCNEFCRNEFQDVERTHCRLVLRSCEREAFGLCNSEVRHTKFSMFFPGVLHVGQARSGSIA